MSKNMVILFFVVVLAAAGYYCYEQGYFNTEIAYVENVIMNTDDANIEDSLALDDDLEA